MNNLWFKNFWGVSASALGTYEMVAFVSKKTPTVSNFCARRRSRRLMMIAWTLGLGLHIWRHNIE